MRQDVVTPLFYGAFAPVLSLDALTAQPDGGGFNGFDITDENTLPLDEQLAQTEGFAALDAFVQALAERDRLILQRYFWLGHTQTAIAADLGVSKMAVSKAVARICREGRERLAPHRQLAFSH
jgi:RNA polymerase sigma factor (sigma-70 family)